MNATKSKRGFFFTVMALALLSFVLMSAQVWVRSFELSEQRAAERFKGESMRLVLASLSDDTMSDFAASSAFYATYRLVDYSSSEGLAPRTSSDADNPGTGLVETTVKELIQGGESQPGSTKIEYSLDEKERYTLESWKTKIMDAANVMGYEATFSDMNNFEFKQVDAWNVRTYFEMDMEIKSLDGTMQASKTLKADAEFPIDGFIDPAITRNDMAARLVSRDLAAERQIFRHADYSVPLDAAPKAVEPYGLEGHGWFFGPTTDEYPGQGRFADVDELGKIDQYILVHRFDDDMPIYADYYGAIVVTRQPEVVVETFTQGGCTFEKTTQTKCLNCRETIVRTSGTNCPTGVEKNGIFDNQTDRPVFVVGAQGTNWGLDEILFGERKHTFLLIDNEASIPEEKDMGGYHRLYDITPLRDIAICGFYVAGQMGPSFFQRMLATPMNDPSVDNHVLGIETFVVGKWAGGADDQLRDDKSRLDREFYAPAALAVKIKGMPGCKSKEMCTSLNHEAIEEGIGKFRLSTGAISRYGIAGIACNLVPSAQCD